MTAGRSAAIRRYLAREITAEQAADLLGPGVSVAEVVLETAARFRRLPDARDAFTDGELRRGLALLRLDAGAQSETTDGTVQADGARDNPKSP